MSAYTFSRSSSQAIMARTSRRIQPPAAKLLLVCSSCVAAVGLAGVIAHYPHAGLVAGPGLLLASLAAWLSRGVSRLAPAPLGATTALEQLLPPEVTARYQSDITSPQLWQILKTSWQAYFVVRRLELDVNELEAAFAASPVSVEGVIDEAARLSQANEYDRLSVAALVAALIKLTPAAAPLLTAAKLEPGELDEAAGWATRFIARSQAKRPIYGGLARDWAAGYTPTLSQFTTNLSRQIEMVGANFSQQERTAQLDALTSSLASGTGSVVLVGEVGIGKTALLYGLADQLLRGDTNTDLDHHQVVSLSAATMMSRVQGTGDLERIVLACLTEAVAAGNMVVALDEAQLFFGQGTGAVNLSQILLPVVQAHRLKLILTLTPGDWQRLRSTNPALAGLLSPIVLTEPDTHDTLSLLADRALSLEQTHPTTWQALRRAYELSSRYATDEANPGRSLKILAASANFADGELITARSVERAVESQYGVKVEQAGSGETDTLLHLEDLIHERMINQTRAVSVVAAALRRARAGVSSPKRPIGSFLFLGPTGVGKTELARSLAAIYFGAESNIIRLDMSEYQQPTDVARLLASASDNPQALLPRVKQQPFSVILFDEIEKANSNILNLLLQLLDEGTLTDSQNKPTSFKDAIIIATSNAGADDIRARIEAGAELEDFEQEFTDKLIAGGSFKPELLNRFDEIVLFRPLKPNELLQVVKIMLGEVNRTLEPQKVTVELTEAAAGALVAAGYDPRLGARPMRRMVQRTVEDAVAGRILRGEAGPGTVIHLDTPDLNLAGTTSAPQQPPAAAAQTTPPATTAAVGPQASSTTAQPTQPQSAAPITSAEAVAPSATSLHGTTAAPGETHKLR